MAESELRKRAADEDEEGERNSKRLAQDPASARIVQFYSKSKDEDDLGLGIKDWRKRLSNFWPCTITVAGKRYASIEHYFHAAKALCSDKPAIAASWELGGNVGACPAAAKKAGGRGGFAKAGATLDMAKWETERDRATSVALRARVEADEQYALILRTVAHARLHLLHFERQAGAAYWGGAIDRVTGAVVGRNRLGELLMELGAELVAEETRRSGASGAAADEDDV